MIHPIYSVIIIWLLGTLIIYGLIAYIKSFVAEKQRDPKELQKIEEVDQRQNFQELVEIIEYLENMPPEGVLLACFCWPLMLINWVSDSLRSK